MNMSFKENNNSFYTFYNGDFDFCVRAINEDGEIWFPVKDILVALKCSKKVSYEQIEELIPEMWLDYRDFGKKEMFSITEDGLRFLLNQWTNKIKIKMNIAALRCWIDNSVVPSILENNLAQDENAEIRRRDEELSFKKAELLKRVFDIQSYAMNDEAKLAFIHEIYRLVTGKELPSNVNTLPKTSEVKEEKYYTAEELGKMFGVSANKIGRIAKKYGLKSKQGEPSEYGTWICDKSRYSSHECLTFVYNDKAVAWFKEHRDLLYEKEVKIMEVFDVNQETVEKLQKSLINFVARVADGTISTPEEVAILPVMTKIILEKLHIKTT